MTVRSVSSTKFFGDRVAWYDLAYDARSADGHALRSRLQAILEVAGSGPGAALDIGMGPGRLCEALAARGWTVSGVDASQDMVDAAGTRLAEAASRFFVAEAESLPFGDGRFDLATASGVLEYADVGRALREIARVVRPGGRAIVTYPNPRALYGVWKTRVFYPLVRSAKRIAGGRQSEMPRGAPRVSPAEFRRLLEHVGLGIELDRPVSYLILPSPLDMLLPRAADGLAARLERRQLQPEILATQVVFSARREGRRLHGMLS